MAFELIGPSQQASIDLCDELVFELGAACGLAVPVLDRLRHELYDSPSFTAREAGAMGVELKGILRAANDDPLLARRTWEGQPPAFRRHCAAPSQGLLETIAHLIAVCEDGAGSGDGLRSSSD